MRCPLGLNHPVLRGDAAALVTLLESTHGIGAVLGHVGVELGRVPVLEVTGRVGLAGLGSSVGEGRGMGLR